MSDHKSRRSFWDFLRAFGDDWLASMSGPASVPFAIAAVFVSGWARPSLLFLAATCIVFASFRVWKKQREEIVRLRARPYDEDQRLLVKAMLGPLGSDERDVLRYFVRFGERESQRIYTDAGIGAAEFGAILTRVDKAGILERQERPKVGRASTDLFWRVNPQFVEVLKDELFPRQEGSPERLFRSGG
jgi:hypothetical protein